MRPIEDIFKELLKHPDLNDIGASLVLDDALEFPIVLAIQEQDDCDREMEDEGPDHIPLLMAGDIRFEVSDGFPGDRGYCSTFRNFREAAEQALLNQKIGVRSGSEVYWNLDAEAQSEVT